jgi:hypothetical protein
MRPVETFPGIGREGRKRRMMEGEYSLMIHCKKFCKCHNVPQYNIIIIKKKKIEKMKFIWNH